MDWVFYLLRWDVEGDRPEVDAPVVVDARDDGEDAGAWKSHRHGYDLYLCFGNSESMTSKAPIITLLDIYESQIEVNLLAVLEKNKLAN